MKVDLRQGVRPAALEVDLHPVAQSGEARIGGGGVGEGVQPAGIEAGQRHRHGQAQAEFGLEPSGGLGDVADPVGCLIDPQHDLFHRLRGHAMRLAQLAGGLDRAVRQVAGGVVLEQIVAHVQAAGRGLHRQFWIEIGAVRAGEALGAFQHVAPAGEAARREPGRKQAVIGRLAGMERLAHRAEHRFQPRRLGAGDAERNAGGVRVQPHQMRAGGGRAEAADGAGGVKAQTVVMAGFQGDAEAAFQLVAGHEGGDHRRPRGSPLLRQRQQRGQDGDARVAGHRQVHVVEIERVRGRAIDQRGR